MNAKQRFHRVRPLQLLPLLLSLVACTGDDGDQGPPGPPGTVGTPTDLRQGDDVPGLSAAILALTGATGSGGHFRVGDTITVQFRLRKDDGSDWDIAELATGRVLISGPTTNYQRVIAELQDVLTVADEQGDGSYTYRFPAPIPATYLPPLNDSPTFGPEDGELTGQPLLEGTYTVGMTFSWNFTVDGESERDSANAVTDFVIGNAGVVEPREVVKIENCNRCHEELRIHGGRREDARLCVLCHTAGAEDENHLSIDFKVMVHKIHAGEHLPSVLGVATNPDGSRDYAATPTAYVLGGDNDFSHVAFPAWPHALVATPRDEGYTALSSSDKAKEDAIRTGPSNCAVCHGDPDGEDGPLTEPAQGDLSLAQPSRQACGSCHDDVHWGQNYTANGQTMPAQANNANCKLCHDTTGNALAVSEAHLHPLQDPGFDTGVNLDVIELVEAGTGDGDGTIDVGEKIALTFAIVDDAGADIAPATVSNPSVVISGPTDNYNLLLNTSIPVGALTGAPPFTVNVPMPVLLDLLGASTAALDTLTGSYAPHWTSATTTVYARTATSGGSSSTTAAIAPPTNYVDVADATGFARDDYVVLDDGLGTEEYARIALVDGTRLWFASSVLSKAHAAGAALDEVTLVTKAAGVDYSLDAGAGSITELVEFGNGATVVASYTTDFVLPATYPLALNASPDLADASGKWTGKSLVDGTYSLSIWTSRTLTLNLFGESNSYRSTSDARQVDFLVGDADTLEPYELIASGSACFNCHQELAFHGFGRRGFESCVVCHGAAGGEDRPTYVAANAPATTGTTVSFRTMLHKIHMGEELANASSYTVVGFGSGSYPDNFTAHTYGEILFPALPGGTENCTKCHGNDAWHEPAERAHPSQQDEPIRRWAAVCGACHDSTDEQAHIAVQTDASGAESCAVCHGHDGEWSVERMHRPY